MRREGSERIRRVHRLSKLRSATLSRNLMLVFIGVLRVVEGGRVEDMRAACLLYLEVDRLSTVIHVTEGESEV